MGHLLSIELRAPALVNRGLALSETELAPIAALSTVGKRSAAVWKISSFTMTNFRVNALAGLGVKL
jgi:hypothetical protein